MSLHRLYTLTVVCVAVGGCTQTQLVKAPYAFPGRRIVKCEQAEGRALAVTHRALLPWESDCMVERISSGGHTRLYRHSPRK